MKLQHKLIAPLSLLTIIPLMLLGVLVAFYAMNNAREQAVDEMDGMSKTVSTLISSRFDNAKSNLQLFANSRLLQRYLISGEERYSLQQPALIRLFKEYQQAYPEYFEISVLLSDGFEDTRVVNRKIPNIDMDESGTPLFETLSQHTDDSILTQLLPHTDTRKLTAYLAKPLIFQDPLLPLNESNIKLNGYLVIAFDTQFLKNLAETVAIGQNGFILITNKQDEILFKPEKLGSQFTLSDFYPGHKQNYLGQVSGMLSDPETNQKVAIQYLAKKVHINDKLSLVTLIPENDLDAVLWEILSVVFLVIVFVVVVILLLIYRHIYKLFLSPIYKLRDIVTSIGEGNLNTVMPVEDTHDEFGDLYDSIQKMRLNLNTSQQQVKQLAYYDELTGLPNRITLRHELDAMINKCQRSNGHFAVVFIDLDNFKDINDTLGHDMGDILLKEVSRIIVENIRTDDYVVRQRESLEPESKPTLVARLGGDEFTLLLGDIENIKLISGIVKRLLDSFSKPIIIGQHEAFVGASMGIAIYPQDGATADELLKNADLAMYKAKKSGKNNFEFFCKEMNAIALQRLALESNLRRALERNEFVLFYQPRVYAHNANIDGFEALIRWDSQELGMVSPAQFIPFAEESLLICDIGQWVLETACQQIRQWVDEGHSDICVSVNLSPRQIYQGDTLNVIENAMQTHGVNARNLEIEITESGLLEDEHLAIVFLDKVRALGIRLALDDFGTGYSSLSYLRKLPINILKIDRSFVIDVVGDKDTTSVLETIISLAEKLSLETVAEGVETTEQLEILTRLGCNYIQGYYFSKPLPLEMANEYLRKLERLSPCA